MNRRRRLLLLAALAAPLAYAAARRPRDLGGPHPEYFAGLQDALRQAGLHRPTLVVDREQLRHNLGRLKTNLPRSMRFRAVAKSLPSVPLLRTVLSDTGSDRLMVFHQPHINAIAREMPEAQLLLGKPMPVGAARRFFDRHRPNRFDVARQIEWLVDTPQRLAEYAALAPAVMPRGRRLRVNVEIDIGLHRGGVGTPAELAELVRAIRADPALEFSGLMGYEAHCAKTPAVLGGPRGALRKALAAYSDFLGAVREVLGPDYRPESLTLNAGGSMTYELYDDVAPCNELAIGSALVKPTDFDLPSLADHQPASYIATPVLKALEGTRLPGLEAMAPVFRAWDRNTARSFFIYGGHWLAEPVSPPGLRRNALWGHSSNQELLNGSARVPLQPGDYVFLRPHQSESVFLQFGDIAVYDGGRFVESWPVLPDSA